MAILSKQDRQGVRTPADLERKHNFGKKFSEVTGIATDARTTAEEAVKATANLDVKLTQEELFNRLTNNGQTQGLFRDDNGQIYINAEYIVAVAKLFAKDITMSGTLTNTMEAFLEPGDEEIATIQNHIIGNITIPDTLIPDYDFNNDGVISTIDALKAEKAKCGIESLADWSGARTTPVTFTIDLSNPESAIQIVGKNMWGREINEYIGVNGTSLRHRGTVDYVVEEGTDTTFSDNTQYAKWRYRKWNSGLVELWCSSEHTHPEVTETNQIVCTVPFPFTVHNPYCVCQGGAYCWNFARPIYVSCGTGSMSLYLYPRTDMAGTIYNVYSHIAGQWK